MLDKKDIQVLRQMFGENNKVLRHEMRDEMQSLLHIQKREMRDEIHAVVNGAVFASEARMMKRMDNLREEILDGVSDIIGNEILPQIDGHEARIVRLERLVV